MDPYHGKELNGCPQQKPDYSCEEYELTEYYQPNSRGIPTYEHTRDYELLENMVDSLSQQTTQLLISSSSEEEEDLSSSHPTTSLDFSHPPNDSLSHESSPSCSRWFQKFKHSFQNFLHSQSYAHLLMMTSLLTFGGFCVLAPQPIRAMQPAIFSLVRSVAITLILLPLSLVVDRTFSFRSRRVLSRIQNPILRLWKMKTPPWKVFKRLVLCGSMNLLNIVLFIVGLDLTNATMAGILQPLVAVEVCFISIVLRRESRGVVKILGVFMSCLGAIAMVGVSTLTATNSEQGDDKPESNGTTTSSNSLREWIQTFSFTIGMVLILLNTLTLALYIVLLKKLTTRIPTVTLSLWTYLGGLYIPLIAACFYIPSFRFYKLNAQSYIGLAYAIVIHGALSLIIKSKAAGLTSPTVIGIYNTLSPIVTTFMTVFISGERVSLWNLPGAVAIVVGLVLVVFSKWREEVRIRKETKDSSL
ncbi:hypothetical protein C9374_013166 [Naegleria lovaniensis]|uniref:EamA domain-containing protein n=1 Tax=Naegleria lovaniensis TaxID=51637 RepID=A0AA88KHF5_NAELO|nr:uncharacterized protein C9374_013166 [Naegleria lovaniensis]KAG2372802.1 hypothetical protein C9374_013166 [Naegleria lovaniensis]